MAITKYKNHTSINTIENRMVELNYSTFSFDFIYRKVTVKEINKLCNKKASQNTNIPVKIFKEMKDIISFFFFFFFFPHHNFNNSLPYSTFSNARNYVDNVKPIHKKDDDKTDKENYRPVSNLPSLSKIYERIMYNQICPYFNTPFSKFQCGFRKGFNKQPCQ